jgi:hypothetical protein
MDETDTDIKRNDFMKLLVDYPKIVETIGEETLQQFFPLPLRFGPQRPTRDFVGADNQIDIWALHNILKCCVDKVDFDKITIPVVKNDMAPRSMQGERPFISVMIDKFPQYIGFLDGKIGDDEITDYAINYRPDVIDYMPARLFTPEFKEQYVDHWMSEERITKWHSPDGKIKIPLLTMYRLPKPWPEKLTQRHDEIKKSWGK